MNSPRSVHDGEELDVNIEPRAEGPVTGSQNPEPEELPQIETPGNVTSAVPTCASEKPSLLQTEVRTSRGRIVRKFKKSRREMSRECIESRRCRKRRITRTWN